MPMFKHGCVLLFLILASACGGNGSPTAPATTPTPAPAPTPRPSPPPPIPTTWHLTGIATDDDGGRVTGATVTVLPFSQATSFPSVSGVTDGSGFYSIDFDGYTYLGLSNARIGTVIAESPGRDHFLTYISAPASGGQNVSQNLHLYRITRITAGESTLVTVVPGDTSCDENGYWLCRIVHIVVPTDGLMTMEVVPTPSAANTGLTFVNEFGSPPGPSVLHVTVTAGIEVVVAIGMLWTSTVSQSGVFKTSLASAKSP